MQRRQHMLSVHLPEESTFVDADPARLQQIFSNLLGNADGFGIGLAVVRRLVAAHGGSVTVKSDGAGCGSECTVTLPRAG